MKKICFWILFVLPISLHAQNYDSVVTTGIKQIYNIKFTEAEKTFRSLIADYPNKPAGRFFLAMVDWWKILINPDNESYDDIFFQKLEDVIFQCDELLDKNPDDVDALFFKGGAIGFRGRLRAYRESWIKAADDGREALPIVEHAYKLDPNNLDVQLGFGIYNYYASVIPNEYPLIKPLMIFFPDGDKQKGIEQLTNTAANGKYAKYEARYFLMTLYYTYENNPHKAETFAKQLTSDFPDNPVFERWYGRVAAKKGNYVQADSIFRSVWNKAEKNFPGYNSPKAVREAAYYIAYQNRVTANYDSAMVYFKKCEEISRQIDTDEESGFLVYSVLYQAQINDTLGRKEKAIELYESLLEMRDYGNAHSIAENNLEKLKKN